MIQIKHTQLQVGKVLSQTLLSYWLWDDEACHQVPYCIRNHLWQQGKIECGEPD